MQSKNSKTTDWQIIPVLLGLVTISGITFGILSAFGPENTKVDMKFDQTNSGSTATIEVDLDLTNVIQPGNIRLSDYDSAVTIASQGTYTFTGESDFPIIVNAGGAEIEIILDGVEISSANTAAIIGLDADNIIISTAVGSQNKLTDGGSSQYDGCIFSNAELTFTGSGTLEVNGQQTEGEGIATEAADLTFKSGTYHITSTDDGLNAGGDGATITIDGGTFYIDAGGDGIDSNQNAIINDGTIFVIGSDAGGDAGIDTETGFTINGGAVIALGSDMLETPLNTSKQRVLALTLDQAVTKNTIVTLMKDNQPMLSFSAPKSFKTILISTKDLTTGAYEIYTGGTHTGKLSNGVYSSGQYSSGQKLSINNISSFEISKTVNQFGHTR